MSYPSMAVRFKGIRMRFVLLFFSIYNFSLYGQNGVIEQWQQVERMEEYQRPEFLVMVNHQLRTYSQA